MRRWAENALFARDRSALLEIGLWSADNRLMRFHAFAILFGALVADATAGALTGVAHRSGGNGRPLSFSEGLRRTSVVGLDVRASGREWATEFDPAERAVWASEPFSLACFSVGAVTLIRRRRRA